MLIQKTIRKYRLRCNLKGKPGELQFVSYKEDPAEALYAFLTQDRIREYALGKDVHYRMSRAQDAEPSTFHWIIIDNKDPLKISNFYPPIVCFGCCEGWRHRKALPMIVSIAKLHVRGCPKCCTATLLYEPDYSKGNPCQIV